MAAATYNFSLEQGASFATVLTFQKADLSLIDITGCTFRGQIRPSASDLGVLASFNCQVLNQSTNQGQVSVSLTAAQTSMIPANGGRTYVKQITKYVYDIEKVLADGVTVDRVLEGVISFSPEVTR